MSQENDLEQGDPMGSNGDTVVSPDVEKKVLAAPTTIDWDGPDDPENPHNVWSSEIPMH